VEQVIEPEMPEDCEGLDRLLIGKDVSERLDVTPAKFQVIVTRRRNMPTETVMSCSRRRCLPTS
jgi:transposase